MTTFPETNPKLTKTKIISKSSTNFYDYKGKCKNSESENWVSHNQLIQGLSPYVQVENLAMMILAIYKPLSRFQFFYRTVSATPLFKNNID